MNKLQNAESKLSQVHEGMAVYDAEAKNIGVVTDIYLGSDYGEQPAHENIDEPQTDQSDRGLVTDGIMAAGSGMPIAVPLGFGGVTMGGMGGILPTYAFEDEIPKEVRSRLMTQGFVQIRGNGILGASRYIATDQVASVHDDAVYLNVSRGQLNQSQ